MQSTPGGHGFTTRDGWIVDRHGRHTILRGVNLGGSSKVPRTPDGATHLGVDFTDWRDVSFVGRPFPLDEAGPHLDRIAHWGFCVLRLLTTWEAVEHAGPGVYDEQYLDYLRAVVEMARERGLWVFVDPHHDCWSRWSGGDGAPFWTFEMAGLRADRFEAAGAVELHSFDWPANYDRAPSAAMWTLFLGGETFCPSRAGVQETLQRHFTDAMAQVALRLADLDNVLGYDTFNEPHPGYIGRGPASLSRRVRYFGTGPMAPSALEHLAAADGVTVRCQDGTVLNPAGTSIWADGCPWRAAGVWDVAPDGTPTLSTPSFFEEVDGAPAIFWEGFMAPFVRRVREALRRAHPGCMLFVEGAPLELDTPWDDPDPLVVNARHWYDVPTLMHRSFDPERYQSLDGATLTGVAAIAAAHTKQLRILQSVARERMRNRPVLLGEFGVPFDVNGGHSLRTGDWAAPQAALDACYRALDATLMSSTQWNYTVDNTHADGDGWNHEDLSVFSVDDVPAGSVPGSDGSLDLDAGGRAVPAFCRPYLRYAAGIPVRMSFDLETGTFECALVADPQAEAPTEVYVPRLHYPSGVAAEVTSGRAQHDPGRQILVWDHLGLGGEARLRITPR